MSNRQLNSHTSEAQDDTYHHMRINNPIKYGEELVRMYQNGHNQKEIATMLSCNRQMVGRYQRIGKWPDEVKTLIQTNRHKISNTKILNLATRALSDSDLLLEIKTILGESPVDGEIKSFPTVGGFNELISKLEAIESRLANVEKIALNSLFSECESDTKNPIIEEVNSSSVRYSDGTDAIHNQISQNDRDMKTLPIVTGFSDLMTKLEVIESRLTNLEQPKEPDPSDKLRQKESSITAEKNPGYNKIYRNDLNVENDLKGLSWNDLIRELIRPQNALLLICISILTAYLGYQGIVFFSAVDSAPISAISSALISELIPFLAAACFALAIKKSHRFISLTILLISIGGLGIFMHNSLATKLTQGSGKYERLAESRKLTTSTIHMYSSTLENIPENHTTKRQLIVEKIKSEREKLAEVDSEIDSLEKSGGSFQSSDLGYSLWIRIASMMLNAFLVHLFFSNVMSQQLQKRHELISK